MINNTYSDSLTVYPDGTGIWPTIQDAISNSTDGDLILLADGIFKGIGNRDINTEGKSITIKSENSNPDNCIIDCEGTFNVNERRGFIIINGEDSTTVIKDISIIHGSTMQTCPGCTGAAVLIEQSAPLFENVVFRNNHGSRTVFDALLSDNLIIRNCKFYFNIADFNPCIEVYGNNILIEKCIFYHNSCNYNGSIIAFARKTKVIGCTITNNYLNDTWYSTVFKYSCNWSGTISPESAATIENTLVTNNYTLNIFHHHDTCFPMPLFNHCNHWNNNGNNWVGYISEQFEMDGNISENPLFVDTLNLDYHIQYGSPCIDAGNPYSPNDPDGTIADIGYYYYQQFTAIAESIVIDVTIFPNPSNGTIHFAGYQSHSKIFDIQILNNSGKTLKFLKNVDISSPIDLSELPNGIYFCYLKNNSSSFSQKLIIRK